MTVFYISEHRVRLLNKLILVFGISVPILDELCSRLQLKEGKQPQRQQRRENGKTVGLPSKNSGGFARMFYILACTFLLQSGRRTVNFTFFCLFQRHGSFALE